MSNLILLTGVFIAIYALCSISVANMAERSRAFSQIENELLPTSNYRAKLEMLINGKWIRIDGYIDPVPFPDFSNVSLEPLSQMSKSAQSASVAMIELGDAFRQISDGTVWYIEDYLE